VLTEENKEFIGKYLPVFVCEVVHFLKQYNLTGKVQKQGGYKIVKK